MSETTTQPEVPAYLLRCAIRINTDKHGRARAHYFGMARRWLPLPVDVARAAQQAQAADDVAA